MKSTVLYVDDEEVNLFLFEKIFEREFDVLTASSGTSALEKLKTHQGKVDVVISDMRMPEMNGLEFIKASKIKFKDIYYFILTGYEFNPELEAALESHLIDKVFKKPFDYDLIKSAIEQNTTAVSSN